MGGGPFLTVAANWGMPRSWIAWGSERCRGAGGRKLPLLSLRVSIVPLLLNDGYALDTVGELQAARPPSVVMLSMSISLMLFHAVQPALHSLPPRLFGVLHLTL